MKNKKIIIAGGSGFIGQEMIKYFCKENTIIILTRQLPDAKNNRNRYAESNADKQPNTTYVQWDGKTPGNWVGALENADLLINLAGQSVNCRYTQENKNRILDSRVDAVNALGEAVKKCTQPPALWINASSATIYRHATDRAQDEYTGEIKDDFSVQVCKQWEEKFFTQPVTHTRKIALRMAITLGAGGVLIPYFNLLKFALGGRQGSGKQMFSWVHITDTCRMIDWITEHKEIEGIYNCSSPNPVTNKIFMQTLRKAAGHFIGLPATTWMLKLGAAVIGTETELVLKSRWVVPTKILETGFRFEYPQLKDAMENIIAQVPRKQYHLF